MEEGKTQIPGYNNCFTLGGKCRKGDTDKTVKLPVYIRQDGVPARLSGGKDGRWRRLYELSYPDAARLLKYHQKSGKTAADISDVRVSLYLDNAMYGDLHIFVIDFDEFDEQSTFFLGARALADKVTRSQGGGYHMFCGIDKNAATPLFDGINLLVTSGAPSYISKTGAKTRDGKNKVDFFCDTRRLIYEWEEWDNAAGLTDCTEALYRLIREHFVLERTRDYSLPGTAGADGDPVRLPLRPLEQLDETELLARMSDAQKKIFEELKTISSDCDQRKWISIGFDLWHAYGSELGGKVFRFWSAPGHSFDPKGCAQTWECFICPRAQSPDSSLKRRSWRALLQEEALSAQMNSAQRTIFEELKANLPDCRSKAHFSMGLNIWHVFGSELGGEVFRFWSEKGRNFQPRLCDYKWRKICERGPASHLSRHAWRELLEHQARQTT